MCEEWSYSVVSIYNDAIMEEHGVKNGLRTRLTILTVPIEVHMYLVL